MFGSRFSWLRTGLMTLAGLLLASGATWAHGGGHGGGGHGGFGGGFHHGGIGYGGYGFGYGGYGRGFGLGYGGFGLGYGLGYGGYGLGYGLYGLGYGLGYGLSYGNYGLGYGYGGYPYGYGYSVGYPYYGYSSGYGAYPYTYGLASASSNAMLNTYSSYYPSVAQQPQAPPKDNRAHLLVILPANAELWFNGTKTTQTGSQREFYSPVLTTGKHYSYEIKATWLKDGERMEQVRTAEVQANDWQKIDFTKSEFSAAQEK